jgi:predicted O-linked N-acetylglucosamine transferase (SPINDLY family)
VFCILPFLEYLKELNKGDICLSVFPFGGANSVIDTMCLGLPTVCLRTDDCPGRTDSAYLSRHQMPAWLFTHNEEEYIEAALRLIHNDEERVEISKLCYEQGKTISAENPAYVAKSGNYREACWQIYQKHEILLGMDKKRITLEELEQL